MGWNLTKGYMVTEGSNLTLGTEGKELQVKG